MIPYYKLSGGGNDFIALAEPERVPSAETIRLWCRRRISVGSDGLFVLRRRDPQVEMEYFNSDGCPADLCLNAARCAARLAAELGWTGNQVQVRTTVGVLQAEIQGTTRVSIEAPLPRGRPEARVVDLGQEAFAGWSTVVGVPHFVFLCEGSPSAMDVDRYGALLRRHPDFGSAGTNVDFVRFPSSSKMEIRSFERGIEGETLACGTGVLAAAAVGVAVGEAQLPIEAVTRGGFRLEVQGQVDNGGITRWCLIGDARLVASGSLMPGSEFVEPC